MSIYAVLSLLIQFFIHRIVRTDIVTVPRDALVHLRVGMAIVLQGDIMIANVPLPIEGMILTAAVRPGGMTGIETTSGVTENERILVIVVIGGMTGRGSTTGVMTGIVIESTTMIATMIAKGVTNQ